MVSIFKDLIAAEKMGKWKEHLDYVVIMLPYFHAAGHLPYANSVQLYLQYMRNLPKTIGEDYKQFTEKDTSQQGAQIYFLRYSL